MDFGGASGSVQGTNAVEIDEIGADDAAGEGNAVFELELLGHFLEGGAEIAVAYEQEVGIDVGDKKFECF